jgi:hypothetical protein
MDAARGRLANDDTLRVSPEDRGRHYGQVFAMTESWNSAQAVAAPPDIADGATPTGGDMKIIQLWTPRVPDLARPSPEADQTSLWEAVAVIVLGLLVTAVGMAAALVAFAEKLDAPRPPDPWGHEVVETRSGGS